MRHGPRKRTLHHCLKPVFKRLQQAERISAPSAGIRGLEGERSGEETALHGQATWKGHSGEHRLWAVVQVTSSCFQPSLNSGTSPTAARLRRMVDRTSATLGKFPVAKTWRGRQDSSDWAPIGTEGRRAVMARGREKTGDSGAQGGRGTPPCFRTGRSRHAEGNRSCGADGTSSMLPKRLDSSVASRRVLHASSIRALTRSREARGATLRAEERGRWAASQQPLGSFRGCCLIPWLWPGAKGVVGKAAAKGGGWQVELRARQNKGNSGDLARVQLRCGALHSQQRGAAPRTWLRPSCGRRRAAPGSAACPTAAPARPPAAERFPRRKRQTRRTPRRRDAMDTHGGGTLTLRISCTALGILWRILLLLDSNEASTSSAVSWSFISNSARNLLQPRRRVGPGVSGLDRGSSEHRFLARPGEARQPGAQRPFKGLLRRTVAAGGVDPGLRIEPRA